MKIKITLLTEKCCWVAGKTTLKPKSQKDQRDEAERKEKEKKRRKNMEKNG